MQRAELVTNRAKRQSLSQSTSIITVFEEKEIQRLSALLDILPIDRERLYLSANLPWAGELSRTLVVIFVLLLYR